MKRRLTTTPAAAPLIAIGAASIAGKVTLTGDGMNDPQLELTPRQMAKIGAQRGENLAGWIPSRETFQSDDPTAGPRRWADLIDLSNQTVALAAPTRDGMERTRWLTTIGQQSIAGIFSDIDAEFAAVTDEQLEAWGTGLDALTPGHGAWLSTRTVAEATVPTESRWQFDPIAVWLALRGLLELPVHDLGWGVSTGRPHRDRRLLRLPIPPGDNTRVCVWPTSMEGTAAQMIGQWVDLESRCVAGRVRAEELGVSFRQRVPDITHFAGTMGWAATFTLQAVWEPGAPDSALGAVTAAARSVAASTMGRDSAIRDALTAGHSLREVGAAADLSHTAIQNIRNRP